MFMKKKKTQKKTADSHIKTLTKSTHTTVVLMNESLLSFTLPLINVKTIDLLHKTFHGIEWKLES